MGQSNEGLSHLAIESLLVDDAEFFRWTIEVLTVILEDGTEELWCP